MRISPILICLFSSIIIIILFFTPVLAIYPNASFSYDIPLGSFTIDSDMLWPAPRLYYYYISFWL